MLFIDCLTNLPSINMFNYKWYLKDNYQEVERHDLKVFSTFACGGGSTMGYK